MTCARVCLAASACGSQTELPWHQEPSRAHRLGNERPYKGLLSVPFQRSARPLPGTRRSTACTSHVTHSPQATGLSLCSSLACLQGPQLEEIHEVITLRQQKVALDTPSAACRQNDKAVSCQPPKYSWFQQSAAQLRCGAGEEVLPSHFRLFLITFTRLRY